MSRINVNRLVSILIIPVLIMGLFFSTPFSAVVFANPTDSSETTTETSEGSKDGDDKEEDKKSAEKSALEQSIKEKEAAISSARNEKNALAKGKTDVEKIKQSLEKSKADLSQYVTELDAQVVTIEDKILDLKGQIAVKEKEIEQTKKDLEDAIATKDYQYECMKKRVKAIYEQGDNFYLELLLNSNGLGDFLNQMDYIEDLSKYDDRMFKEYQETVEYVTLCEEQLEEEESLLQATKKAAEDEQAAVEALISEKEAEIAAVQDEIVDQERAIREYEAEIAEQNATISELERIVAQEKKALENMRVYDGGAFCWPCPAYKYVSSDFGNRIHPTLKINLFHNGVDLAAPAGSNILAAYDGEVVSASYTGAMGNYVMIDHGGGLYTVYMHASKLNVSEGQEVKRGDVIAFVGSTGRSTGNHLHFSVRSNGEYVSPWNYIVKP
ncbi:MAG: peptidoglycan DD-metalloendopeptidase family protein [Lachnospiraceae bacterium]|nr:peptidoglycan DD-metalloendopeptidase family protein [Lachnospiraceae bacterium]MBR5916710.1 peptidoglycan DD-metalloendopeptidase family protein [Lachnospiraceae bacterium]